MAAIVRVPFPAALAQRDEASPVDPWSRLVGMALAWSQAHGLALRDAVFLVPFAQHLPLARQAWVRTGGWMPRVDTTQTLARSLQPIQPSHADTLSFSAPADRLTARRLLSGQSWAFAWASSDALAFEQAVSAMVQTAHSIARAAADMPPAQRDAWFDRGRAVLAAPAGPAARERVLLRVAWEWAAATPAPASDSLFRCRPSAWMAVQAGGPDALTLALMAAAAPDLPCFLIDTDTHGDTHDDPLSAVVAQARVRVAVCSGFEDEAQRTAAQVLAALSSRSTQPFPVALIAQDRLLVRRVRALLARQGVPLQDETGWKLSTTRAAAAVIGLLRAAQPQSGTDDRLDWLKSCPPRALATPGALRSLERALRRGGWGRSAAVPIDALPAAAADLWQGAQHALRALNDASPQPLGGWLERLHHALDGCGLGATLASDDAGMQLLAALGWRDTAAALRAETELMSLAAFTRWVQDVFEDATYRPQAPPSPAVVVTPLAQAMLRPFCAVVFPGADDKHLAALPAPYALLSDSQAIELGLPGAATRAHADLRAFVQILSAVPVDFLYRIDDDGEPLTASPWLQRLALGVRRAGQPGISTLAETRIDTLLQPTPTPRPTPCAPDLLPERLSASACEALRACPYRFFALRMLGLREADELDGEVEKRDFGTWLHAVLLRFHETRTEPQSAEAEQLRLQDIADALQTDAGWAESGSTEADFLPFAATFKRFAPRYIAWLHERDAQGAAWLDGEREWTATPKAWAGTAMHGVIDRIDSADSAAGPVTQLIDYKTGSAQALRNQLRQPSEDTQLAFYAALMAAQSEAIGEIGAMYLALDDADGIKAIEHADVLQTAQQLLEGIGHDLARLRGGAAMPALGEGRTCDFCEARGLCRRDQWPTAA